MRYITQNKAVFKTINKAVLISLFLLWNAHAGSYVLDKSHAGITFKISHMMISTVTGNFTEFDTKIVWNEADLKSSALNATIQAASINTQNEARDKHLRNEDFFDVEKFPTITFASEEIFKTPEGYKVKGTLTMKNVSKTVIIDFIPKGPITDPYGNKRIGLEGTFTVNRQDYGVSYNSVMDSGGLMIGNEVEITIAIEAIEQK